MSEVYMICLGKKGYVVVVRGIYAQTDEKEKPNASNPDGHFNRVIPPKKTKSFTKIIYPPRNLVLQRHRLLCKSCRSFIFKLSLDKKKHVNSSIPFL